MFSYLPHSLDGSTIYMPTDFTVELRLHTLMSGIPQQPTLCFNKTG